MLAQWYAGVIMNHFLPNISQVAYLRDDVGVDVPTLSQTIASVMCTRSPWHAHRMHPKLGGKNSVPTPATDKGALMHALLLGQAHEFAVVGVDDFRTKLAREARDAAINAGQTPVKKADYDAALEHAAHIDNALRRQFGVELGRMRRELTAVWQENGDVVCKARFDAFDGTTIYDLKTCSDASVDSLARRIIDYDYHLQAAAYCSAAETIVPAMMGRIRFVLLFIENETNAVVPVDLDSTFREYGRHRWEQAVSSWRHCLASGEWPAYAGKEPVTVFAPEWYRTKNDTELSMLRDRTGAYV